MAYSVPQKTQGSWEYQGAYDLWGRGGPREDGDRFFDPPDSSNHKSSFKFENCLNGFVSFLIDDGCPPWYMAPPLVVDASRKETSSWVKAVKNRDRWQCVECGSKHDLAAHHIQSFSQFPELATELSNGETLCHNCHWDKHR